MGAVGVSRASVVRNAGPGSLLALLKQLLPKAKQVDIAVAFVTATGLDELLNTIKKAAKTGRVRLLTGLFQSVTEPQALRVLLREQQQSKGRIAVRLSLDRHFHWKVYFAFGPRSSTVIIGSSNLTRAGLGTTGELNLVLSGAKDGDAIGGLHKAFEVEWTRRAKDLNTRYVQRYETERAKLVAAASPPTVSISRILGGLPPLPETSEITYRRDWVSGFLKSKTNAVINDETDWDRRGWGCFGTSSNVYSPGDKIAQFDFVNNRLRLIVVKDVVRTHARTPDGRHFAAYLEIPRAKERRLAKKFWVTLKASGLVKSKSDAQRTKRLSADRWAAFVALINDGDYWPMAPRSGV
jgi:HKD family nuclease